ncbi:MAG: hypothetical protein ACT4OS_06980 [Acidimicrobiales bacterium]
MRSEIDVVSCRTTDDVPLLRAGAFGLEMSDGERLEPSGSRLKVNRSQPGCIEARILFDTGDASPMYATYRTGDTLLRWPLR